MGWHSINGVQRQYFETKNSLWSWYKEENKFAVENQEILIKTFALLRQIRPFTSWQLSVRIFISKLAKEHQSQHAMLAHCIVWTGEGWEGTWGPLVGDPGDLWTLGGMPRGGAGQCFSLCRSSSPLGIQLRGCFDCSSHIHFSPIESPLYFIAEKPHISPLQHIIKYSSFNDDACNQDLFRWYSFNICTMSMNMYCFLPVINTIFCVFSVTRRSRSDGSHWVTESLSESLSGR